MQVVVFQELWHPIALCRGILPFVAGGGSLGDTLYNCILIGNQAFHHGGGATDSTLYNCVVTGNSASFTGGGIYGSTLYNCTVTGNSASSGGGVDTSSLSNCLVYYNVAQETAPEPANYRNSSISFSCTKPLPPGQGNFADEPQLASAEHLSATSPCIGAGSSLVSHGVDIDSEPWLDPPCVGADQFVAGSATGAVSMTIELTWSRFATDFAAPLVAHGTGPLTASVWDFGDGTLVTNRAYINHAWRAPGIYPVRLTGYNDSFPSGITTTSKVEVIEAVHYVNTANPTPAYPYTTWPTAATNIQDAISAGLTGARIWVTNGIYDCGGVAVYDNVTNRVALTNGVRVESVNGPAATIIAGAPAENGGNGDEAIRCAYVANASVLSGFTLTNGYTHTNRDSYRYYNAGGAWCEPLGVVTNCLFTGNSAYGAGGGASGGSLFNSVITGNTADLVGGGVASSTLYDCLIFGNAAKDAGAATGCLLFNCTVVSNSSPGGVGGVFVSSLVNSILYFNHNNTVGDLSNQRRSTLDHSCTIPLPDDAGSGNLTNAPVFVDAAAGDFRLRFGSPGIDAGTNLTGLLADDFAGTLRPLDGDGDGIAAFDMGAYELDLRSVIDADWYWHYGLDPTNPEVVSGNPDHDPQTTFQEWMADTDPTNALSFFRLEGISNVPPATVYFPSSTNRLYTLFSSTNLLDGNGGDTAPVWMSVPGQTDVPGIGTTKALSDASATTNTLYRVGVRVP